MLLKQVVKGKFSFKPEERWRHISQDARDLITKLIVLDPTKRFTVAQVKEHPWCADAVAKCAASMPKMEAAKDKKKESAKGGGLKLNLLQRLGSRAGRALPISGSKAGGSAGDAPPDTSGAGGTHTAAVPKRFKTGTDGYASREQQFWYQMEISPPTNMQQQGGVKIGSDGKFQMDNVSEEMRAILEDIERKKQASSRGSAAPSANLGMPPPPPPPGAPPPSESAEMQRLQTQTEAEIRHRTASETMDTLLLMGEKDNEIAQLREQLQEAQSRVEELESKSGRPSQIAMPKDMEARLRVLQERAEAAEEKVQGQDAAMAKLQAKLTAVSTLYTESMQREAVLKVQLDQLKS